jgi:membrane protein DedA with SNARE-associated domain
MALDGLLEAALSFVREYGYVALFVFILLETAWIIHFVPSEVVIPVAATQVVVGPTSFVLFVTVLTVGAVFGSLLAYYLFGRYGEVVLRRYGSYLRVPESEIERSKAWFRRYGEHSLAWMRLVPVLRTPISIPAGYAETSLPTFVVYSGVGWLCYNVLLVGLVYSDGSSESPLGYAAGVAAGNPGVTAVGAVLAGGVALWAYLARDRLSPGGR